MARTPVTDVEARILFSHSLKGKGMLFLILLFGYCIVLAGFVLYQKSELVNQLHQLEQIEHKESALVEADLAAFASITELLMIVGPVNREETLARVHRHFITLQQKYSRLESLFPDRAPAFKEMLRHLAESLVRPSSSNLISLRQQLAANKIELDALLAQNRLMRQAALQDYLAKSDWVAALTLMAGLFGLLLLGAVVAIFFIDLTRALLMLKRRVAEVVRGYRGEPLEHRREDEVGVLIAGFNEMTEALRAREQDLEIERQKRFHQDKMGTIGHLAAGLVHEIGNPVAAILGLTQELQERMGQAEVVDEEAQHNLDFIFSYADRLRRITEDLTAFHRPQHDEYEWLDLNETLENVCNLLHYDERWYGIELIKELDLQLPAIRGSGDQLSQLFMGLLINAFEAMENVADRKPQVRVLSAVVGSEVRLSVLDNGCGIETDQKGLVFDAFYSTKTGKPSAGLGMLLCYAIVTDHGGRIQVESEAGSGTQITVFLPVESLSEALAVKISGEESVATQSERDGAEESG